jgi:flagellar biosynthesis/type III secretory pathway M-ring protein FliF/YscJ
MCLKECEKTAKKCERSTGFIYAVLTFIIGFLSCLVLTYGFHFSSTQSLSEVSENEILKQKQEKAYAEKVTDILEKIIGKNQAKVDVSLEISYDKVTENEEIYDPAGYAVRIHSSEPKQDSLKKIVQYEVNKYTISKAKSLGTIKKISAIVLIDGYYEQSSDGVMRYHERSMEEISRIAELIEYALGIDYYRGDILKIENIRFADKSFLKSHYDIIIYMLVLLLFIVLLKNTRKKQVSLGEKIKASSLDVKRINEVIDSNPAAALEVIRAWLAENKKDS